VIQQESFEALTGQALTITTEGETVMVNGAKVLTPDLTGSNGVIHVIDTVLTPPAGEIATAGDDTTTGDTAITPGGITPAQSPVAAGCAENYVVQASDTLSLVADKYLGDPQAFAQIVEATNTAADGNETFAAIDDPDLIEVGQTICIPGSPEAQTTPATTGEDEVTTAPTGSTTLADEEQMAAIPEGKAKLVFENFSFVDLVFDVSGPTPDSLVVVPDGKNEFILEPGTYNYNAHQPGGDFSVAPGSFELAAGETLVLSCSDSPVCSMQEMEVNSTQTPASNTGQQ
jgi:LysM repeat protein